MLIRLTKGLSFLAIIAISVALGITTIGSTFNHYEQLDQFTTLEQINININKINSALKLNSERSAVVHKIMHLIDRYNESMPSSQKYTIANEIYKMDLKYDNLNVDLICATITHESALTWDPKVISDKGAVGLMQIMPKTGKFLSQLENIEWDDSKKVLYDPIKNIRMGCRYLSTLIEFYGVEGGLAAYNGGEKRAAMWLANNKENGILWQETQDYVPAVMKLYKDYQD